MAKKYSIAEARDSLAKLVQEAESGQEVELTRRGRPVAVLVGRGNYERLVSGSSSFLEMYPAFSLDVNLAELAIDPEAVFHGARGRSPGQDVSL